VAPVESIFDSQKLGISALQPERGDKFLRDGKIFSVLFLLDPAYFEKSATPPKDL